jgi:hypothetical protein
MCKGQQFDRPMILLCVRYYLAHGLSLRDLEEMMAESGAWRWIMPPSTARPSTMLHSYWSNFIDVSGPSAGSGTSTRSMSKSAVAGCTCTMP